MRLFIAVNFPKEIKREIGDMVRELGEEYPYISWVTEENLHLTLKFLGQPCLYGKSGSSSDDRDNLLQKVEKGIENSIRGVRKFSLTYARLGIFDREQLIVWLGLNQDDELIKLVHNLEKEMSKMGYIRDKRSFKAHITIGRGKKIDPLHKKKITDYFTSNKIPSLSRQMDKPIIVTGISLMNSTLTPLGSVYNIVKTFTLGGRNSV